MPKLKGITLSYLLRCDPLGNGSAAVFRREVFEDIKFQDNLFGSVEDFYFDEQFRRSGGDVDCWLRIVTQTSWLLEGIPEALTLYRVNTGGLSANLLQQIESVEVEKVIEKTRFYAPQLSDRWEDVVRAYHLRCVARNAVRLKVGSMAVKLDSPIFNYLLAHYA